MVDGLDEESARFNVEGLCKYMLHSLPAEGQLEFAEGIAGKRAKQEDWPTGLRKFILAWVVLKEAFHVVDKYEARARGVDAGAVNRRTTLSTTVERLAMVEPGGLCVVNGSAFWGGERSQ